MRNVLSLSVLFILATGSFADAETLKCWNTYARRGAAPTIVASIVSDEELADFQVNRNPNDDTKYLKTPEGNEIGSIISSNRSPYKGMREFDLAGSRLILPPNLDAGTLEEISRQHEGRKRGENGVIIGRMGGTPDAGDHFSVRLRCRAYEN